MLSSDINNNLSNNPVLSVSEISQSIKRTMEDSFSYVKVRGEISGAKRAGSGHLYFSLKDDKSLLSGICWKGVAGKLGFDVEDGLEVICTGRVTTYPGRSNYQIIVEKMEIAGVGALMAILEKRKKQLSAEGLFDKSRKVDIPFIPKVIGVITSPTGAVIRDILHRVKERFPVHVIVWPVIVQGENAKNQIADAINGFNEIPLSPSAHHLHPPKPDVLIVARGGGSLEDLWAFNEEIVVRAVSNSKIPIISAVGHETDTTLIDYVADVRAPTPTAAAEIAVPVREELLSSIFAINNRLYSGMVRLLRERNNILSAMERGLTDPQKLLELANQRLDDWSERLESSIYVLLNNKANIVESVANKLLSPTQALSLMSQKLENSAHRLEKTPKDILSSKNREIENISHQLKPQNILLNIENKNTELSIRGNLRKELFTQLVEVKSQQLNLQAKLLESYHYKKVLERGFSLVRNDKNNLVKDGESLKNNDNISIEFANGTRNAIVTNSGGVGISKNKILSNKKKPAKKNNIDSAQESLF